MRSYLKNWNLMRFIRLALGTLIVLQGIQENEWMLVLLGGIFFLMPLLNIGCFGGAGCNVPLSKSTKKIEETAYEEVR